MALYKNVLHHAANEVPKWFLEALGVLVSALNGCAYCVHHHATGMTRLLDDADRAATLRPSLEAEEIPDAFDERQHAAAVYARKLTTTPADLEAADVETLRRAGWSDGEILVADLVGPGGGDVQEEAGEKLGGVEGFAAAARGPLVAVAGETGFEAGCLDGLGGRYLQCPEEVTVPVGGLGDDLGGPADQRWPCSVWTAAAADGSAWPTEERAAWCSRST